MVQYIYEQPGWPDFTWKSENLTALLGDVRHKQGRLLGQMEGLGFSLQSEAWLQTLTQDVVKSSEIEGEKLNKEQVRSSLARRLGIEVGALPPADRHVEGIVEMMLDATQKFEKPLTAERLFGWQAALFPTGRSGLLKITVGNWRTEASGPMQVVSGRMGHEKIHFEAPSASQINPEMLAFLKWFNSKESIDPLIKAALAHLWFVTIHPFEDGNGRIARAITDMVLAQSEQSSQRFYSMSAQIQQERKAYYDLLEQTQKGGLDVTPWLTWFLECLSRAIENAKVTLGNVLYKANFWRQTSPLNERQQIIINRLLDGFEGNLTTSKWATLAKCSQDTAYRDILDLVDRGILIKNPGGGRSTSYTLKREG